MVFLVYFRFLTGITRLILSTLNPTPFMFRARTDCVRTQRMCIWMTIDSTITKLCRRDSQRWLTDRQHFRLLLVRSIIFYCIIRLDSIRVFPDTSSLFFSFSRNSDSDKMRARILLTLWLFDNKHLNRTMEEANLLSRSCRKVIITSAREIITIFFALILRAPRYIHTCGIKRWTL